MLNIKSSKFIQIAPLLPNVVLTGLLLAAVYIPNLLIHLYLDTPFHVDVSFLVAFAVFGFVLSLSDAWCFGSVVGVIFVFEVLNTHCLAYFGAPLGVEQLLNMQKDWREILQPAFWLMVWYILPLLLILYSSVVFFYRYAKLYRWRGSYVLLCMFLCFKFYADSRRLNLQQPLNPADVTLQNTIKILTLLPYAAQIVSLDWQPYEVIEAPVKSKTENILLIMGESLTPTHLPMFGYERNTLPLLSQRMAQDEHWQTALSVSGGIGTRSGLTLFWTLTREPGNINNIINATSTLFNLAHNAGFKNYYFSAQEAYLLQDVNLNNIDEIYTNEKNSAAATPETEKTPSIFLKHRDDELVTMLDKVNFKTDKNFVVVNLRVPHAAYEYHYAHRQAEFRKFLPDNPSAPRNIYATNAYDNALLYMDDVINELIERFVAQAGDKSYSIYITADHGQLFNFQGQWGHGQLLLETAKVPFFYYHQSGTLLPPIISHYQIGKLIALDLGFMVLNPNECDNTFYVMENNLFFNTNFIKYRIDGNQLIELKKNNVINLKDKLQKSIY